EFLQDFRAAVQPVAWLGLLNSLSMVAIKYTSPGVPDCYQGNETWDFSLVDPDNRRPVDYALRQRMLAEMQNATADAAAVRDIFANLPDGRAKLFVTWRLLQLRREREELFLRGSYIAARSLGAHARSVVAFARRHARQVAITVAPRLLASCGIEPGALPCGDAVWIDTRLELPFVDDGAELTDAISGARLTVRHGGLALAEILATSPVAVLTL
ncbi:MAG TPA: malto-oligosyltrehalose synthase, partial [Usitatibacter sp.]|nr:malto-oligosyltrehalose synthase [Usitatibacter sp.]